MPHHHHHQHGAPIQSLSTVFILSITLNLLYVGIEALVGLSQHSLGLLSDAGHNLSDVFSLLLALLAYRLAAIPQTRRFTYGYRRAGILVALANAIILLIAIGAIVIESIHKFAQPAPHLDGSTIATTAGIGIIVNGLTAWLLMRKQAHDINIHGAYLHMLADTLVSIGVVLSGIAVTLTGWTIIDPIISLIIAAVILASTLRLLNESVRLAIDAVPEQIDRDAIETLFTRQDNVIEAHHLHIWALGTTDTALTAHIVVADLKRWEPTKANLKTALATLGITHATLEAETTDSHCHDTNCGTAHHHK